MTPLGGPSLQNVPQGAAQLFGLFLAFGAIPRIVLGPVLVVIEGVTFLLFRGGVARALLAGGILMDVFLSAITRCILHVRSTSKRLPAILRVRLGARRF